MINKTTEKFREYLTQEILEYYKKDPDFQQKNDVSEQELKAGSGNYDYPVEPSHDAGSTVKNTPITSDSSSSPATKNASTAATFDSINGGVSIDVSGRPANGDNESGNITTAKNVKKSSKKSKKDAKIIDSPLPKSSDERGGSSNQERSNGDSGNGRGNVYVIHQHNQHNQYSEHNEYNIGRGNSEQKLRSEQPSSSENKQEKERFPASQSERPNKEKDEESNNIAFVALVTTAVTSYVIYKIVAELFRRDMRSYVSNPDVHKQRSPHIPYVFQAAWGTKIGEKHGNYLKWSAVGVVANLADLHQHLKEKGSRQMLRKVLINLGVSVVVGLPLVALNYTLAIGPAAVAAAALVVAAGYHSFSSLHKHFFSEKPAVRDGGVDDNKAAGEAGGALKRQSIGDKLLEPIEKTLCLPIVCAGFILESLAMISLPLVIYCSKVIEQRAAQAEGQPPIVGAQ